MNTTKYSGIESNTAEGEPFWTRNKIIATIVVSLLSGALIAAIVGLISISPNPPQPTPPRTPLDQAIDVNKIMYHLVDLNTIADLNGGTRAMSTPGYNASVQYVVSQLRQYTDYEVSLQDFYVNGSSIVSPPTLRQTSPIPTDYTFNGHFGLLNYFAGVFDITGNLTAVLNYGCNTADYTDFPAQHIALVRRGVCTNGEKLVLAKQANAAALIIFNEGNVQERTGLFIGSLGGVVADIPVFALVNNVGEVLSVLQGVQLHITANNEAVNFFTQNVIAETVQGSAQSVVLVGAHLDSVPAGPGINDDGSGTANNLELAIQTYNTKLSVNLVNKIRFVWFAAEELGLLGSHHYVDDFIARGDNTLHNIKAMLNFDMLGSPNFIRGIYNGASGGVDVRNGSTVIQSLFEQYFTASKIAYQLSDFNGRSDYGPFIAVGIPAGGLFTGAEVVKNNTERLYYGGLANSPFDPCYHLACDTIDNINVQVLEDMSKNSAHVLETLALQQNLEQYLSGK